MYFEGRLSCPHNNSRPSADTAACLPGLHNHVSATDPQTVYFSSLKFPWVPFLPLPSNSCVLHLLDSAKQFKIWTDEGLKTKWFEIYRQSWATVAYRLLFGKKNPHFHALWLAPFFSLLFKLLYFLRWVCRLPQQVQRALSLLLKGEQWSHSSGRTAVGVIYCLRAS